MNKFNINELFNVNIDQDNKVLDVKSIYQPVRSFNIKMILDNKNRKRKTLLDIYIKLYNICVKKIEIANSLNKSDLLYTVDAFMPNVPEYNSLDCINYIKTKLTEAYFDVCIVDRKTLFITWIYLEINTKS
jgi:hypothetical protein